MLGHTKLNEAAMFFCIFRPEPWLEPTAVLVILKCSHSFMLKNVVAGRVLNCVWSVSWCSSVLGAKL